MREGISSIFRLTITISLVFLALRERIVFKRSTSSVGEVGGWEEEVEIFVQLYQFSVNFLHPPFYIFSSFLLFFPATTTTIIRTLICLINHLNSL